MTQKIIIICLCSSFFSGCFTPDDIKLTDAQKTEQIEAMYKVEYENLQLILDKSCNDNFDKYVNRAVDSLVNVYLDSTKYDY